MTLKQYNAFVTSVEEGSISKASKILGVTQGGITHLINDLEKELGFLLMTRNKGGIKLTNEGKKLFPLMKNVLSQDKHLIELSQKIKGNYSNKINIATFTSVAVNWLPSIINGFKQKYPYAEITFTNGGYSDIKKALNDGVADIGFINLSTNDNFKCFPLIKDEMLAVLPEGHPLTALNTIDVKHFETESVISLGDNTDNDSRAVFENANVTPNIKYRTTDDYAMISMVKNNLGICIEPNLLLSGNETGVKIKALSPPSYRIIALAVPYENLENPLIINLINYILDWVKNNCKNHIIQ